MRHKKRVSRAFTVVELLVIIVVISILAGITVLSYGAWQKQTATKAVLSDIYQATSGLKSYQNFKNSYPPNLAGTNFASSPSIALTLYTNAPSVGVYTSLTSDQNAQLFLNACNANLNGTNNTTCTFNGSGNGAKIHVHGTGGINFHWQPSPLSKAYIQSNCASICAEVAQAISQFESQGGVFSIVLSGNNVSLPEPTDTPNGPATRYCLEGRSGLYPDVIYHSRSENTSSPPSTGACPADPDLQYFP